jgi:hypothetical protein
MDSFYGKECRHLKKQKSEGVVTIHEFVSEESRNVWVDCGQKGKSQPAGQIVDHYAVTAEEAEEYRIGWMNRKYCGIVKHSHTQEKR